ncbi:MAG: polysaccharide deacetylase family protein [Pseudomonadota bacterium]
MSREETGKVSSLSLDLDNQWSYMKTHGNPAWESYPSYLGWAVPRILEYLEERQQKITFFVVGKDATYDESAEAMKKIADAGHEIGNHSFNHEPWLHLYSEEQLHEELEKAETAIENATGVKPVGFRGPGFSLSSATLRVLAERGYEYDATVFPNLLNPLARAYFFATSSLTKEEKEQRKELFGTWRDALRPNSPYDWKLPDRTLLEIPVTTMPVFKTPIHLSYIIYASRFSKALAKAYFSFGLFMCRLTNVEPSILLHPLDFVGGDDVEELKFFPGMDVTLEHKLEILDYVLDAIGKSHRLVTMKEHAESIGTPQRSLELEQSRA